MARKWTDEEKQRLIREWGAEVSLYIRHKKYNYRDNEVPKTAYTWQLESMEIDDLTLPVSKCSLLELIYAGINTFRT